MNPIVEEMHYRGHVQPRLEALSGSSQVAIDIMAAGLALQHAAYAPEHRDDHRRVLAVLAHLRGASSSMP